MGHRKTMTYRVYYPIYFHWGILRYLCKGIKDVVLSSGKPSKFEKESLNHKNGFFSKIPLPTTFHWQFEGGIIYVSGEWDSWQRHFPLCNSGLEYGATVPLFPGIFRHKYSVDGMLKVAPSKVVEDLSSGNLINFIDIERIFWEKDIYSTHSDEMGTNHFRMPFHLIIMRSCKTFDGTEHFPSHQVISINFMDKDVPEIYYLHKRVFNNVLLPFSNYLNHIFFPSLASLNLDIFLKVPILPSRKKGKMFTNFFFGNLDKNIKEIKKKEKLNNFEKFYFRNNFVPNFLIQKIKFKEKSFKWKKSPIFIFFGKCFW